MTRLDWHILLVEDELDSVQVVSTILTFHGIDVTVARDGLECLDALDTFTPTAIIMDLSMPNLDGWATLAQIRDDATISDLPVIAITAYHSANVAQDAMTAGFDAYFPKPVDAGSFVDKLQGIIAG
ncbi:MAG: response regulator [Chloroflexi bacterium]|nr:response regulator [Chloroflexota bacterium]